MKENAEMKQGFVFFSGCLFSYNKCNKYYKGTSVCEQFFFFFIQ